MVTSALRVTGSKCRFHIIGAEPSFQTVTAVETEMLESPPQTLFYSNWNSCLPSSVSLGDTVIGHIGKADGIPRLRAFVEQFKRDGAAIPRIIVIADELGIEHESEVLELGVAECLIRPLNLRRFNYLLRSIQLKSQVMGPSPQISSLASGFDFGKASAKLAAATCNVLFIGETGVGKSYFARKLHLASPRAERPFVVINCAAIPFDLFESELFGHEKGSFTGADHKHAGKLAFAKDGTVLLDDVDAIPLSIQPKLLHAVENREFYPVGSNHPVKFNARLFSATNRNLEELANRGEFRSDLMFRLNAYELRIAPLRERPNEIVDFVAAFMEEFARENNRPPLKVHPEAMDALKSYSWPGNIRELRNAIQFGAINAEEGIILLEHLPEKIRSIDYASNQSNPKLELSSVQLGVSSPFLDDVRRLVGALIRHNFNRTAAAAELGYSRTTLYHKLDKLQLI